MAIPSDSALALMQEVLREAESYLSAQLTAAIAADQRAFVFAGLLSASVLALLGGGVSLVLAETHSALGYCGIAAAFALLIAMGVAIFAARPVNFEFVGNSPQQWAADIAASRPLTECLAEQATHYSEMIASNGAHMKASAFWLQVSLWWTLATLTISGVAALVILTHC